MKSNYLHMDSCPSDLAKGWYERGKEEVNRTTGAYDDRNDVADLFRFVSYWIAFNHLYNYGIDDIEETDEITRIKNYCDDHMETLINLIDFDAEYMNVFKDRPILSWQGSPNQFDWSSPNAEEYIANSLFRRYNRLSIKKLRAKCRYAAQDFININDNSKPVEERIKSLMISIYKVRCNLFHGMKTPDPGRDYDLVKNSADVLETCLEELINETFHRR